MKSFWTLYAGSNTSVIKLLQPFRSYYAKVLSPFIVRGGTEDMDQGNKIRNMIRVCMCDKNSINIFIALLRPFELKKCTAPAVNKNLKTRCLKIVAWSISL